jgi:SAM-dependent methyltransferase
MEKQQFPSQPSSWVTKFASLIPENGLVLDLACGSGRHAVWLAEEGYKVDAVDYDPTIVERLKGIVNINVIISDIENGNWPSGNQRYDGIIVSRYLYRPVLKALAALLNPEGVLIYETFMVGNERYGKPSNPDYLLLHDELNLTYAPLLHIHAFEQGEFGVPVSEVMQRICAIKKLEFK